MTASAGQVCIIEAGDAVLMEDTTGKGHATEITSEGPVEAVIVQLA